MTGLGVIGLILILVVVIVVFLALITGTTPEGYQGYEDVHKEMERRLFKQGVYLKKLAPDERGTTNTSFIFYFQVVDPNIDEKDSQNILGGHYTTAREAIEEAYVAVMGHESFIGLRNQFLEEAIAEEEAEEELSGY